MRNLSVPVAIAPPDVDGPDLFGPALVDVAPQPAEPVDPNIARAMALLEMVEAGRKHREDELWSRLPEYIHEESPSPSGSVLTVSTIPKSVLPILVQTVVWSFPSGATSATLQLGDWLLPLQNTFGDIPRLDLWLDAKAPRTLTWVGQSGTGFLGITARELPYFGKL